jgi:hypothetical protein
MKLLSRCGLILPPPDDILSLPKAPEISLKPPPKAPLWPPLTLFTTPVAPLEPPLAPLELPLAPLEPPLAPAPGGLEAGAVICEGFLLGSILRNKESIHKCLKNIFSCGVANLLNNNHINRQQEKGEGILCMTLSVLCSSLVATLSYVLNTKLAQT